MLAKRLRGLRFAADMGLASTLQVGVAVLSYVLNLVVINILPKEEYGFYAIALATVIVAGSLTDFGIAAAAAPRIAVARGADTPAFKASVILRMMSIILTWIGINVYLWGADSGPMTAVVNIGFISILFSSKFSGLRQFPEYLWRLKGRTYLVTALSLIDTALQLGIVGVMAAAGALSAENIMIAMALGSVPGFIVILVPLWGRLRDTYALRRRIPYAYYRGLLAAAFPMAVFSLFAQVSGQLEMFVVNYFGDYSDVASVSAPIRAIQGAQVFATTIAFGVAPIVAQLYKKSRTDVALGDLAAIAIRLQLLLGFMICLVCMILGEPIMALFGKEYVAEVGLLRIYSVVNAVTFLVILLDQMLVAIGYRKQVLYGVLIQFGCAAVLEALLINWYGLQGVLYAKLISTVALISWQIVIVVPEIRSAALEALRRWAVPVLTLAGTMLFTESMTLALRGGIIVGSAAAAIVLTNAFPIKDLKLLRELRVT